MPNAKYSKLKRIGEDFTCGEWIFIDVLSPQRHVEKAEADLERQPGVVSEARLQQAYGKWAVVFGRPIPRSSRGDEVTTRPFEAIVAFTPQAVTQMDDRSILRDILGTVATVEFHELLEWAQLRSAPGVPIIDPHVDTDDVEEIFRKVAEYSVRNSLIH